MAQDRNEARWLKLWKDIGAKGEAIYTYRDLQVRYAEKRRVYHVFQHIEHCLDEFEAAIAAGVAVPHPHAVAVALWLHDAIYDPMAKDNEERSAELASMLMRGAQLDPNFQEVVFHLIRKTKHDDAPQDLDAQLITDIDLSILGRPRIEFDEYERRIAEEYAWVPKEIFTARRREILSLFEKRPRIYATQFFFDKYESQARENISYSLAKFTRTQ